MSRQSNVDDRHFESWLRWSLSDVLFLSILFTGTSTGFCEETNPPQDESLPFDFEVAWNADVPDRDGLKRDTGYFLGYQVVAVGILYAMPESVTSWTDEQKSDYSMSIWWDNVTHPGWDTDDFYINYVIHPYWGAAYYVRASERGYDRKSAFWYSVLLSSLFEFGAEALAEEPSIQDLIITPTLGSLLGHYFMGVRSDIRAQTASSGHRTTKQKWVMVLTDPLGSLNRQVDKLVGHETSLQVYPYFQTKRPVVGPGATTIGWEEDRVIGLAFHLRW